MKHLTALVLLLLVGCARRAADAASDLNVDDIGTRASAASDIEDEAEERGTLPRDVVDVVLRVVSRESDEKTRGRLILALGYSGDVRAKLVLDAYARTDDPAKRKIAAQALQVWAVRVGRYPKTHVFDKQWPYGTEAYPSKLAKQ